MSADSEFERLLERIFVMGQNYFADADSESYSANRRADAKLAEFRALKATEVEKHGALVTALLLLRDSAIFIRNGLPDADAASRAIDAANTAISLLAPLTGE